MFVALVDIFLTVLYARSGTSLLSGRLHRWTWRLFRRTALSWAPRKDQLLAFAGPVLLLLTVVLWVVLLSLGFSLIIWPALGAGVEAPTGETPTDFAAALYYAGYNLTTLGTGDLVPQAGAYRLLSVFMAATGFSILTLLLTFFTSVYSALVRRNTFALGLHHRTAGTADATVLLSRLLPDGEPADARQELTAMSEELINLYESQHFYPVLHYFRFQETAYALARLALLTLDTVSLIRSALDERTYRPLVRSAAVAALWGAGCSCSRGCRRRFCRARNPRGCARTSSSLRTNGAGGRTSKGRSKSCAPAASPSSVIWTPALRTTSPCTSSGVRTSSPLPPTWPTTGTRWRRRRRVRPLERGSCRLEKPSNVGT